MNPYPSHIQGSTAWLYDILSVQCEQINSDLAEAITSPNPPHFKMFLGQPLNPAGPTIAVTYASTSRSQIAQHEYRLDIRFRVMVLIPHAGDDSGPAFEMARQVAAENLQALFADEFLTLTPTINAGTFGTVQALCTSFSGINDLFPRKSSDGKSVVRGFEVPLTISFSVASV